ncbi:hypothetical protein [uncultured Mucilaginibacter sp.]|uniref:hypothetical protein n=1 Tax=uncultured Mucilaginibacter sp. TaxID=797541 RepID=UPI0026045A8E|nr:hypothetical protein [uncultured Mucilaginibacter sp.]
MIPLKAVFYCFYCVNFLFVVAHRFLKEMPIEKLKCRFLKSLKTLSLFLLFLLLLISCNKEKLTKPTQTGANTFSCKINGKVYVAKTSLFSPGLTGGLRGASGRYEFEVEAIIYSDGNKASYTIDLGVSPNISEGTYPIASCTVSPGGNGFVMYNASPANINFTHIDYAQRIISGTFSFTAVNTTNANDVISVTDGRFDMKN